jgi:hypothetical protein
VHDTASVDACDRVRRSAGLIIDDSTRQMRIVRTPSPYHLPPIPRSPTLPDSLPASLSSSHSLSPYPIFGNVSHSPPASWTPFFSPAAPCPILLSAGGLHSLLPALSSDHPFPTPAAAGEKGDALPALLIAAATARCGDELQRARRRCRRKACRSVGSSSVECRAVSGRAGWMSWERLGTS